MDSSHKKKKIKRTPTQVAAQLSERNKKYFKVKAPYLRVKDGARKPRVVDKGKKMSAARYGSKTASLLAKLVRGKLPTQLEARSAEFHAATCVHRWITSHPVYRNYIAEAEKSYEFVVDADKGITDGGRHDVLLHNGSDYLVVEVKTEQKTTQAHLDTYRSYSAVSHKGIPNSKYAEHMLQLIESVRARRNDNVRKSGIEITVDGRLLVLTTKDFGLTEYPLDPTLDRDEIFSEEKIDVLGVLQSASKYLMPAVHGDIIQRVCMQEAFNGIPAAPVAHPASVLGPQAVVATRAGELVGIWTYSRVPPGMTRDRLVAALHQYGFVKVDVSFAGV